LKIISNYSYKDIQRSNQLKKNQKMMRNFTRNLKFLANPLNTRFLDPIRLQPTIKFFTTTAPAPASPRGSPKPSRMSKNIELMIQSELTEDENFIEAMGIRESLSKLQQQHSLALEDSQYKNSIDNADARIVYVNGIPSHWNEAKLMKFFDKNLAQIQHVKLLKNTLGHQTKNCLIHFDTDINAEEFVNKFENDWINTPEEQYHLKCSIFTLRKNQNKIRIINRKRQVMVYNLAFEAKEVEITKIAQQFGTVEDFQMPFISKKKNKGYCLITFAKEKEANFFVESVSFFL
jgi:hypothetical protein